MPILDILLNILYNSVIKKNGSVTLWLSEKRFIKKLKR